MGISQIVIPALILLVASGLIKIARLLSLRFTSLRTIPGPPSAHWLWGDFRKEGDGDVNDVHAKWVAEYGTTFKFHGVLNVSTADHDSLSEFLY